MLLAAKAQTHTTVSVLGWKPMATNDDLLGLALGVLGIGAVLAIGSTVATRRQFRDQLGTAMRERGLGLVNCELGRDHDGAFWHLTVHHQTKGVQVVRVRLGNLDPYSTDAMAFVLDRVTRWALVA